MFDNDKNNYQDNENGYGNSGETSAGRQSSEFDTGWLSNQSENPNMGGTRMESPRMENSGADNREESQAGSDSLTGQSQNQCGYQSDSQSQNHYGYQCDNSYIPQDEGKHRKKKRNSMAAKAAVVTAAALLFGTVAGGTMFAVNTVGEFVKGRYEDEYMKEPVTVAQAETAPDSGSSKGVPVTSAIQTDVSSIVEKAMPSVVAINNTMLLRQQTWFGPSQTIEVPSSGSGIIVGQNDEELLIVTNNHVVEDSKELTVTFIDNEPVAAAIKGTDSDSDLAVIAVQMKDIPAETMSKIKVATMGDSDALKVGQGVIAIGNALGYGQSVTVGYVSALNREVHAEDNTTRQLLQTDAAINPGNSGGALLNMKGEVIGINAAKYSSTEVEGMGYAIPVSQAQDIINELMNKKTRVAVDIAKQGYLGIQGQNIDETAAAMYGMPRGIYVYKITEDSAASRSTLRQKDIITKFDGQTVRTMEDLKEMLTYYEGGDTVNLTVQSLDNGEYMERTVEITLGTKPSPETN